MSKASSARYYQKKKKKNQKESREKYWNLSEEEKGNRATVWAWTIYRNLSKNEKQKQVDYRKRYS